MKDDNGKLIAIGALLISLLALFVSFQSQNRLGGYTAGYWDSADGYKVDGTTVIDGSGNVDGTITSDTGTFSSTLTVSGETQMAGMVQGGSVLSITTSSNRTLTAAEVCNNSVISVTPSAGALNITLPSTTTLAADCLDTAGDRVSFIYENKATAATNTTLVAGTGITLVSDDGSGDVIGQNGWARVELVRVRASEYLAAIDPWTDAD